VEIRLRLTLQFTVLVGLLLLAVLGVNYYQAYRFARESFEERLKERAILVASIHLEQDEQHKNQFEEINKRYQQILPNESVSIFDHSDSQIEIGRLAKNQFHAKILKDLKKKTGQLTQINGRHVIGLVYNDNQGDFFIVASATDEVGESKLSNQLQSMFLSFFIFLVFIVLAGQFLAKKALAPIQFVIKQVTEISAANLHERVIYPNETDEIAQLANTFNRMLDRLEEAFQSQSSFVQNASHELRNPLAAMIGHAETTLLKPRDAGYYEEELQVILQESQRLNHIVNSLLQLSQTSEKQVKEDLKELRLDELVLDVIEKLSLAKDYNQIKVIWPEMADEGLLIMGNKNLLELAISNILDNACKYSDGKIVTCTFLKLGNIIQLIIEDKGIGISEEDLPRIMLPFFRSASVRNREGFGIGLAISKKILELHNVIISLNSRPGEGTKFELTFESVAS
jgi:signal transduction histidine kinase